MTTLKVCTLLAATVLSATAIANDWKPLDQRLKEFRPYVSGSVGVARGIDSEDSVSFFKVGGGVKVGRYIAGELNYISAGEFKQDLGAPSSCAVVSDPATCTGDYYNKTSLKVDGFEIGVVGFMPMGELTNLLARFDIASLKQDVTREGENSTSPFTAIPAPGDRTAIKTSESDRVTYYGVGFGAERKLSQSLFVRGMAEYYSTSLFGADEGEKFYTANVQLLKRL